MAQSTRTDAGATLTADAAVLATADDLRALVGKLRRKLQEQASPEEFTPSQTSVLLRLHKRGPATLSELARAEGMRPQSMSAIVAALERAGLITGAPHPTDGRQTILSVSDAAHALIESNRAAKNDWLARAISSQYIDSERAELVRGIELLHRLLEA
jgi:DNA-binding MarR family transcriptional regulator